MTPCALTLVGREFDLNWEKGRDAGSSFWCSVNTQHEELSIISLFDYRRCNPIANMLLYHQYHSYQIVFLNVK